MWIKTLKTVVGSCHYEREQLLKDIMSMCAVCEMAMSGLLMHTFSETKYLISLSSSLICIFSTVLVGFDCFFWKKNNNNIYCKHI